MSGVVRGWMKPVKNGAVKIAVKGAVCGGTVCVGTVSRGLMGAVKAAVCEDTVSKGLTRSTNGTVSRAVWGKNHVSL